MQRNKGRVIMKFYSHYQGWWLVFHPQLDSMAFRHSAPPLMNYGQIYQAQTISRRGGSNSYLQMKPEIKINYKSAHTNAVHRLGMTEERMRCLGVATPEEAAPRLLTHGLHNGLGFIKREKSPSKCLINSLYLKKKKIKWGKEGMSMSIVFRALLKGQEWLR